MPTITWTIDHNHWHLLYLYRITKVSINIFNTGSRDGNSSSLECKYSTKSLQTVHCSIHILNIDIVFKMKQSIENNWLTA